MGIHEELLARTRATLPSWLAIYYESSPRRVLDGAEFNILFG